jgi:hypothetical protein
MRLKRRSTARHQGLGDPSRSLMDGNRWSDINLFIGDISQAFSEMNQIISS